MHKIIDRNFNLSEEEDFTLNVEPLISDGMMAERLYVIDHIDADEIHRQFAGWWIIPVNFYDDIDSLDWVDPVNQED